MGLHDDDTGVGQKDTDLSYFILERSRISRPWALYQYVKRDFFYGNISACG